MVQPNPKRKFYLAKLKRKDTKQMFQILLHNHFKVFQSNEAEKVEQTWSTSKEAVVGTCEDVLGQTHSKKKLWISDETWKKAGQKRVEPSKNSPTKTVSNCQKFRSLKRSRKRFTSKQRNVLQEFRR